MLVLVLSGYGITFAYRGAVTTRPACRFSPPLCSRSRRAQQWALRPAWGGGIPDTVGGTPADSAVIALSMLVLVFVGRAAFVPLVFLGVGGVAGTLSMIGFFKTMGVWDALLNNIRVVGQPRRRPPRRAPAAAGPSLPLRSAARRASA